MISTHTNLCAVEAIVRLWRSGRMPAEQAWEAIRGFAGGEVEDRVAAGFEALPELVGTRHQCGAAQTDGKFVGFACWLAPGHDGKHRSPHGDQWSDPVAEEAAGGPHSPSANNKTRVPGI